MGPPRHPGVESGRGEERDGDQVPDPLPEVSSRRDHGSQEQGAGQNQQRIVIGEAEAPDRRGRYPQRRLAPRRRFLREGQRQEHDGGVGRVDVANDRLRPEMLRDRERRAGQVGGGPVAGAPQDDAGYASAGERAHQAAQRMHSPGDAANWEERRQPTEQDEQGIARRMADSQEPGGRNEAAIVLQHDGARRGSGVQRERADEQQRQAYAVPPRPERVQFGKRQGQQGLAGRWLGPRLRSRPVLPAGHCDSSNCLVRPDGAFRADGPDPGSVVQAPRGEACREVGVTPLAVYANAAS